MKPEYTPLNKLTDELKGFKVKVKVIQKSEPRQTPPKRKYQRLVLRDDEGNSMRGTIFGEDIDMFEEAIQRNRQYEISNIAIKPVPEAYRGSGGEYQMKFSEKVSIKPLDLTPLADEPQFRLLSQIPRSQEDGDDLIDIVAVVLFVGDVRTIKRGDAEDKVCDILLAGESICRPIKLSAWNEFAEKDVPFYKAWPDGFMVVGFTGVRPVTYQGLSLLTTMSTTIVHQPVGEKADALRAWASKSITILEDWRGKAIGMGSADKVVTTVAEISGKKASSIWQDEKFWVQAMLPYIVGKDVHCYVGCNLCGRTSTDNLGTKFVCPSCKSSSAVASARTVLNVLIADATGSLKVTTYTREAELTLGMPSEQITALMQNLNFPQEHSDALTQKLEQIKHKEMLLQISPTNRLSMNNVLKWVIRAVEVPPEDE